MVILILQQASALNTDQIIINVAIVYVNGLGGGSLFIEESTYTLGANVLLLATVDMYGSGAATIIDASAIAHALDNQAIRVNGSNCQVRNLRVFGGLAATAGPDNGILVVAGADHVIIERIIIEDFYSYGITLSGDYGVVNDNEVYRCGDDNIATSGSYGRITNNYCEDSGGINAISSGIEVEAGASYVVVANNVIDCDPALTGTQVGIEVHSHNGADACHDITIEGNVVLSGSIGCQFGASDGVHCYNIDITSNVVVAAAEVGISIRLLDRTNIVGNTVSGTLRLLYAFPNGNLVANIPTDIQVVGNTFDCGDTGYCSFSAGEEVLISSNTFIRTASEFPFAPLFFIPTANSLFDNVSIVCNTFNVASKSINWDDFDTFPTQGVFYVRLGNKFSGTGAIFANHLTDVDIRFPSVVFPFIQGTTFISADGSAKGWEINAEADMAVAVGQLPPEALLAIRVKVWAVALDAPPGGGGQMHLDLLFNAGGSLEDYNLAANSWTLANLDSEEADYANNKVIHWAVEDGDVGNEIRNLSGGDSLELKVNGGTAVAPDGATNATFKVMEIEFV